MKNWHRESQIFEVWQAHPHIILAKVTPLPGQFITSISILLHLDLIVDMALFNRSRCLPFYHTLSLSPSINVGNQTKLLTTWLGSTLHRGRERDTLFLLKWAKCANFVAMIMALVCIIPHDTCNVKYTSSYRS